MTDAEDAAERRALLHYVRAAQKAIVDLRPAQMRLEKLPTAMSQIGLIVETTETAANQIMQAVDEIMNARTDIFRRPPMLLRRRKCHRCWKPAPSRTSPASASQN